MDAGWSRDSPLRSDGRCIACQGVNNKQKHKDYVKPEETWKCAVLENGICNEHIHDTSHTLWFAKQAKLHVLLIVISYFQKHAKSHATSSTGREYHASWHLHHQHTTDTNRQQHTGYVGALKSHISYQFIPHTQGQVQSLLPMQVITCNIMQSVLNVCLLTFKLARKHVASSMQGYYACIDLLVTGGILYFSTDQQLTLPHVQDWLHEVKAIYPSPVAWGVGYFPLSCNMRAWHPTCQSVYCKFHHHHNHHGHHLELVTDLHLSWSRFESNQLTSHRSCWVIPWLPAHQAMQTSALDNRSEVWSSYRPSASTCTCKHNNNINWWSVPLWFLTKQRGKKKRPCASAQWSLAATLTRPHHASVFFAYASAMTVCTLVSRKLCFETACKTRVSPRPCVSVTLRVDSGHCHHSLSWTESDAPFLPLPCCAGTFCRHQGWHETFAQKRLHGGTLSTVLTYPTTLPWTSCGCSHCRCDSW